MLAPSTSRFFSKPVVANNMRKIEEIKNNRKKLSSDRYRAYWHPLGRIVPYRRNIIYCLVATANFQVIIVMRVVPAETIII